MRSVEDVAVVQKLRGGTAAWCLSERSLERCRSTKK